MSLDGLARSSFKLPAASGLWIYSPGRDTDPGWTAAYTDTPDILDSFDKQGRGYMYFRTQTANQTKVSLDFTGVRLHVCIQSNGAKYQLTINGEPLNLSGLFNSPQCRAMGASSTLSTDELSQGAHSAELTILEASEVAQFRLYGAIVEADIDVGHVLFEIPNWLNLDDLDNRWTYAPQLGQGNWDVAKDLSRAHKQSYTFNCNYGSGETASIRFKDASAVVLWGFLYQDTHYYSVEFDGTIFNADASTSMWRVGTTPIFMRTGLEPSTEYTITYRNFNDGFPDCTSGQWLGRNVSRTCCGSLDALQLWGSMATLKDSSFASVTTQTTTSATLSLGPFSGETTVSSKSSKAGSSAASLAAIGGGVLASIVIIGLFALALCWRWRRGRWRVSEVERGRPAPLTSDESLNARQHIVHPWVESQQNYIRAYNPPDVPVQDEKVTQWAAKPLPPRL